MMDANAYDLALDYIYSFVDFSRTHQENLSPENFDLSRMRKFAQLLGSPQDSFPSIHIAGSKGKGSVSAFCASILKSAGYKVGLYTSPHLKDFEERMQVDQIPIPRDVLVELVDEIKPAVSQVPGLTTFEIMTGLAFLFFQLSDVDLAVIEVGLGGRLDATNIITPLVSVITSLYLDHVSILGDTLEQIAAEKGGIIKPGVPVVSAPQEPQALDVLQGIADEKNVPLSRVGLDFPYQITSQSLKGQRFQIEAPEYLAGQEFSIPLLGDYQVLNAVTALAALQTLSRDDFPISNEAIKTGLRDVEWPGRFEILREKPPVIVDSAHNPASVAKLRETVDQYFPDQRLILVFGISEDKQLDGMLEEILPGTSQLIATQADHPRAMDPAELLARAKKWDCAGEAIPNVGQALWKAVDLAGKDGLVLVAGSIFVAASARIAWFEGR